MDSRESIQHFNFNSGLEQVQSYCKMFFHMPSQLLRENMHVPAVLHHGAQLHRLGWLKREVLLPQSSNLQPKQPIFAL